MMSLIGRIDLYRQQGGWGFVHSVGSDGCLNKFFFHVSSVVIGEPRVDAKVKFVPSEGSKGPVATEIEVLGTLPSVLAGVKS